MLRVYALGRCLLPMGLEPHRARGLQVDIDNDVTAIDDEGGSHPAWSYGLWD